MVTNNRIEVGKICPITGQQIIETFSKGFELGYAIMINSDRYAFTICKGCYAKIFDDEPNTEFNSYYRKNKGLLIGHLLHTKFKDIQYKRIHFKSDTADELKKNDDADLYLVTEAAINESKYPIHRKEKADNILRVLYKMQTFEGDKIFIKRDISFWGMLFLQNFEELTFFLREFEREGLITILYNQNSEMDLLQFTFKGLERIERDHLDSSNLNELDLKREYDIGLSFANEQRDYVEQVATELKILGVKLFYDTFESIDLWGKNLYQHLNDIYKNKCLYCIIFISKEYAHKLWTKHELSSAQARAFKENREYILPTRFDNTDLPGLDETIKYIDLTKTTPKELALMASKKVQNN